MEEAGKRSTTYDMKHVISNLTALRKKKSSVETVLYFVVQMALAVIK